MTHLRIPLVFLALFIAGAACSSVPTSPAFDPSACRAIVAACHDSASAMGIECHKLGHRDNPEACSAKKGACIVACPAKTMGAGAATAQDASSDADPAAAGLCPDYCSCMGQRCKGMSNYPFDSDSICLTACGTWSRQDGACFLSWCTRADASDAGSQHACDHASSRLGPLECF
jgi:hypothetical protein